MKIDQSLFFDLAELVRASGQAALEIYGEDDFGIEYKKDNSPVTRADLKVNQILTDGLAKLTPSIPVISEEANLSYDERKNYGRFWIIDPIDGTKEFIRKTGEFTVNLGLVEKLDRPRQEALIKPTFGIIYIPVTDELFIGGREIGPLHFNWSHRNKVASWSNTECCSRAYRIKGPIDKAKERSADKDIVAVPTLARVMGKDDKLVITCSKDHRHPNDWEFIHNLSKNFYCKLVPCGSTIKICRIAQGEADIYIRMSGINDWDLAAGHAIIEASGGKVTTLGGEELVYNTESQRVDPFIVHGQVGSDFGGSLTKEPIWVSLKPEPKIDWTQWANED